MRYFISTTTVDGWPMCTCGCSVEDNKDYYVETNGLKGDEVMDECSDAKSFSELVAGLLNAFYFELDVSKMTPDQVRVMGMKSDELNIPSAENPTLPF